MARVRDLLRITMSVVVSASLVSATTFGASAVGVGTVVSAERAHVGNARRPQAAMLEAGGFQRRHRAAPARRQRLLRRLTSS